MSESTHKHAANQPYPHGISHEENTDRLKGLNGHAEEQPKQGEGLGLTLIGKLIDKPYEEPSWLVEDMLLEGGLSMLVAKPKIGKSTFARFLAASVAKGDLLLGRDVKQGPVIYIAMEEMESEATRHFRKMGIKNEPIYTRIAYAPEQAMKKLEYDVEKIKPALVIIDPLFRFTKIRDGNDYAEITRALAPILKLARSSDAHIIVVHHAGKGMRSGGDEVLGSTALFGAVDCLISMKRYGKHRNVETRQRYGTDMEESILELDEQTGTLSLAGLREDADVKTVSKDILDFLEEQTDPVLRVNIEDQVEGRTALVRKALQNLVDTGEITRSRTGRKKDPYKFVLSCSDCIPGTRKQQ